MLEYVVGIHELLAAYDIDSVTHIVVETYVPETKYTVFCTINHRDTELQCIFGIYDRKPATASSHETGYTPLYLDVCGNCDDIMTEFKSLCF